MSNNTIDANKVDLNTLCTTLLARVEATNILTNIVNAILNVTQKSDNPISDEIIYAIQDAFAKESIATNNCLNQIEQASKGDIQ